MRRKFVYFISLVSWSYFSAFMGCVIMNAVLVSHMDLSFTECFFEAFGLGLGLPRLLK